MVRKISFTGNNLQHPLLLMVVWKRLFKRRVVITGIGIVSPVGIGRGQFWRAICKGKNGISRIERFDPSTFPSQIAGEIKDRIWDPRMYLSKLDIMAQPRVTQFALAAFKLAKADAGIEAFDSKTTDSIFGMGGFDTFAIEEEFIKNKDKIGGYMPLDRKTPGKTMPSLPASFVALHAGVRNHVQTVVSACSSGVNALNLATERIQEGKARVAITGGVDAPINRTILNLFIRMKLLSERNERPDLAVRPMDEESDKSVLGEGGCVFILEDMSHAKARGARIYCEVLGGFQEGESEDPLLAAEKSGKRWAENMERTLKLAWRSRRGLFVNAHAPGDRIIEGIEKRAFDKVFPVKPRDTFFSSIKASTGSSKAAAGALQAATVAFALYTGRIPPTGNLRRLSPVFADMEKQIQKEVSRIRNPKHGLVSTHAVGGLNASTLLRKVV